MRTDLLPAEGPSGVAAGGDQDLVGADPASRRRELVPCPSKPVDFWYCGESSTEDCGCCLAAHVSCGVSEKTPSNRLRPSCVSAPSTLPRTTPSTGSSPAASQSLGDQGEVVLLQLPVITAIFLPQMDSSARSSKLALAHDASSFALELPPPQAVVEARSRDPRLAAVIPFHLAHALVVLLLLVLMLLVSWWGVSRDTG